MIAMHGPFNDQLGLSLLIEHELHYRPDPERIRRTHDPAGEQAWRLGQIDLLTTNELIDRLYHRPGPWVLGLTRQDPKDKRMQIGTFYRGDPMVCAGLAGHLGWLVAHGALRKRLLQQGVSSDPIYAVRNLTKLINHYLNDGCPQVLFTAGFPVLLEHALHATLEASR